MRKKILRHQNIINDCTVCIRYGLISSSATGYAYSAFFTDFLSGECSEELFDLGPGATLNYTQAIVVASLSPGWIHPKNLWNLLPRSASSVEWLVIAAFPDCYYNLRTLKRRA